MKTQLRIKCPQCGEENLDNVHFKKMWLSARALKCAFCRTVYVYEISLIEDIQIYKCSEVKNAKR